MHNSLLTRTNKMPDFLQRFSHAALLAVVSVSLIACGSDNSTLSNDPEVIEAPVTEDTDRLVRNAMSNISAPLEENYSAIAAMANSLTDSPPVAQALKQISTASATDRQIASEDNQQSQLEADLDIESIMLLLFDQDSGATTQRSGNIVTINPDESRVCNELAPDDVSICTQYIPQFDLQISASSDEAGIANLRFQQQSVISITYAPDSSNIEVRLQGVQTALQYLMDLENEGDTMPEVMQGAIQLAASTNTATDGTESNASLAITEKITITDSTEQISLNIEPSQFSMTADSNTEVLELDIELNGLNFTEVAETESATETALLAISIPGFTGNLQMTGGESLKVSRLGFGKGPFQITVDDAEMIRLTLAQFGFELDGDTGVLTLNQDLDFGLSLNNSTGALDDELPISFTAMFSAKAPGGTTLLEQDNETIQVRGNGPVSLEYAINDGDENPAGNFSAAAGECFIASDQSEQILTLVPCQ